ncbi:hypothetical protein JL100_018015 [Skermanella mucosa]|uniref:hypothetical protein n=1 Tax=Skermanella mucosa TaxID=1789672 RepID=UPI00192B836D|nr:hypothetical protein [Skermanella mucosa]UEM18982.1 hypothetical protein JL100_018015 [Skermanella mucosa]
MKYFAIYQKATGTIEYTGSVATSEDNYLPTLELYADPLDPAVHGMLVGDQDSAPETHYVQSGPGTITAPWTPLDLTPRAWYQGGDLETAGVWPDTMGLYDATQPDLTRTPGFYRETFAGQSVLIFDPLRQTYMDLPTTLYTGMTEGSVFVVSREVNPEITGHLIPPDFGSDVAHDLSGLDQDSLGQWHILCYRAAPDDWRARKNGQEVYASAVNTVAFSPAPTLGTTTESYFEGEVAEIIFFPVRLSDADTAMVEGYLAHKYLLNSELDAGHAYRSAPPVIETPGTVASLVAKPTFDIAFDVSEIPDDGVTAATIVGTIPSGTLIELAADPTMGITGQSMTYISGPFSLTSMCPGDHVITFSLDNYVSKSLTVTVLP